MFTICHEADAAGVVDEAGPWAMFNRLRGSHSELAELDDILKQGLTIAFLIRAGEWKEGSRTILGKCYLMGSSNKDLRPWFEQLIEDALGYYPTFLIVLNGDFWEQSAPQVREALLFHELLHARQGRDKHGEPAFDQEGQPKAELRPHDLEEFNDVVRRYGAWSPDVESFLEAARMGDIR